MQSATRRTHAEREREPKIFREPEGDQCRNCAKPASSSEKPVGCVWCFDSSGEFRFAAAESWFFSAFLPLSSSSSSAVALLHLSLLLSTGSSFCTFLPPFLCILLIAIIVHHPLCLFFRVIPLRLPFCPLGARHRPAVGACGGRPGPASGCSRTQRVDHGRTLLRHGPRPPLCTPGRHTRAPPRTARSLAK